MDKILFTGRIISVKARIRLIRSFDEIPTHQYQGYTLILDGEIDGVPRNTFKVAIGPKSHEQQQFRIGDVIRGYAIPVQDAETEWAEFYKVSGLQLNERRHPGDSPPGPEGGIAPPPAQYRAQGHFRLKRETCERECVQYPFGLTMPTQIILDHWNPAKVSGALKPTATARKAVHATRLAQPIAYQAAAREWCMSTMMWNALPEGNKTDPPNVRLQYPTPTPSFIALNLP